MIYYYSDKILLFIILVILSSCSDSSKVIEVVTSQYPSKPEILTAKILKSDLEKVTGLAVNVVNESQFSNKTKRFILGTINSNTLIKELLDNSEVTLNSNSTGSRIGVWHKIADHSIVLAGIDIQGMQYAVNDYSKEILGLDPLLCSENSFSNKEFETIFDIENRIIASSTHPTQKYSHIDDNDILNSEKSIHTPRKLLNPYAEVRGIKQTIPQKEKLNNFQQDRKASLSVSTLNQQSTFNFDHKQSPLEAYVDF